MFSVPTPTKFAVRIFQLQENRILEPAALGLGMAAATSPKVFQSIERNEAKPAAK